MYWPSPVRRRWSSAARMATAMKRGDDVVGVGAEGPGRRPVGPAGEVARSPEMAAARLP